MDWEESKHPRADDGKFTTNGSGTPAEHKRLQELGIDSKNKENSSSNENNVNNLNEILGKEFKGFKGQDAVNKLLQEKQGHIKGAFCREDIGEIDLIWGDDSCGLQHIIKHREEQGVDSKKFLSNIAEVVENGNYRKKNEKGNFEFYYKNRIAIISPELRHKKVTFLLTAYKTRLKK